MYHNAQNEQCESAWGASALDAGRISGHETVYEEGRQKCIMACFSTAPFSDYKV
jgi:hypothetical protein